MLTIKDFKAGEKIKIVDTRYIEMDDDLFFINGDIVEIINVGNERMTVYNLDKSDYWYIDSHELIGIEKL